ncbi:hypothetical protein ACOARR_12475, partial [Glaesserella parasuis]|uniref:hypothetical protein n=1 Tax=Glaesserella parasuis TaxID=738 RepID=UPI003B7C678C
MSLSHLTRRSASALAEAIRRREVSSEEVVRRSELVVVAVPHDQLPGLVAGLADIGAWQPGQLVLHTDPGYGVEVLAPALQRGVIP